MRLQEIDDPSVKNAMEELVSPSLTLPRTDEENSSSSLLLLLLLLRLPPEAKVQEGGSPAPECGFGFGGCSGCGVAKDTPPETTL